VTEDVAILAAHLERRIDLKKPVPTREPYGHIGATICDSILQAGLNYRFVVAPRVSRLRRLWPSATTTSVFLRKAQLYDLHDVLAWRDPLKLERIMRLSKFMQVSELETETALHDYLLRDGADESLMTISGIGPKTVDYLKILVGLPSFAIDRHVRRVLTAAGISYTGYGAARTLMLAVAGYLSVDPAELDRRIWAASSQA
jgi:hypothetical protein